MLLALQALLAVAVASLGPHPDSQTCPGGLLVRPGQACSPIGPHPAYLHFDHDQAALTERARSTLDLILFNLKRARGPGRPDPTYLVEGYADRSGEANYNLHLSRRRAEAVRSYLVSLGIPANTIGIAYFGEERGAVETPDGTPEPDNRRAIVWRIEAERFLEPQKPD